ncbi:hypothetical protein Q7C36_001472 [Tachysurus vachellii]|uniref:Uncharacterized protein n=1 Tax=Tachysurus vachellii TaxID=175792 RepID=A0AA88TJS6_TACVA|nr:hypothetical protein Q7C36_001472 [Tachysurus vachellii]
MAAEFTVVVCNGGDPPPGVATLRKFRGDERAPERPEYTSNLAPRRINKQNVMDQSCHRLPCALQPDVQLPVSAY